MIIYTVVVDGLYKTFTRSFKSLERATEFGEYYITAVDQVACYRIIKEENENYEETRPY